MQCNEWQSSVVSVAYITGCLVLSDYTKTKDNMYALNSENIIFV